MSAFTAMISGAISSLVCLGLGFGLGWYIKGRGLTGVKIDATNIAKETQTVATEVKSAL